MSGIPEFDAIQFHSAALKLRSHRQQILSSNLANADTPGYKARDINFSEVLRAQLGAAPTQGPLALARTQAGHLPPSGSQVTPDLLYRSSQQPSLDGNTVDPDVERTQFAENAFMTEATLTFLNSAIRSRLSAITGQ